MSRGVDMTGMPKRRITALTAEQEARMAEWAQKWITVGRCTDEADWETFEDAARRCYEFAGLQWHSNVVRVSSPLVLSLAAPIAAWLLERGAVRGAVDDAVDGAVDDAVHGAVDGAVRNHWYYRLGGQWWVNWQAYTSFFRDVCGLELDGDLWDRDRAYADAQCSAGWWWPHQRFTMVCDRPRELHLEQVRENGWGSHRLHCADGPAIRWADGWALYYWHGVGVPADLIEGEGWSVTRIHQEPNQEVRRAAIERLGWHTYTERAGTRIGHPVADPGNPGGLLELFELHEQPFAETRVRVLVVRNGTQERDGSYRRFGLTVPAQISDPVAAAAWGYDNPGSPVRMTPQRYAQLGRRA